MKLKTFNKVNVSEKTEYTVFDKEDNFKDIFIVDYLEGATNWYKVRNLIEKGAEIRFVSASPIHKDLLEVSVTV